MLTSRTSLSNTDSFKSSIISHDWICHTTRDSTESLGARYCSPWEVLRTGSASRFNFQNNSNFYNSCQDYLKKKGSKKRYRNERIPSRSSFGSRRSCLTRCLSPSARKTISKTKLRGWTSPMIQTWTILVKAMRKRNITPECCSFS
jgi:hypothetical protein